MDKEWDHLDAAAQRLLARQAQYLTARAITAIDAGDPRFPTALTVKGRDRSDPVLSG